MISIGQIDGKAIFYLSIPLTENWAEQLPSKGWMVVPMVDTRNTELLDQVAQACLAKNVLYICTVGRECEWAHDWFDETILANRINNNLPISSPDDFEEEPMTTWHTNFDEGVWFAASCAHPIVNEEYLPVDKIICLDLTGSSRERSLKDLVAKINSGWLPDDE